MNGFPFPFFAFGLLYIDTRSVTFSLHVGCTFGLSVYKRRSGNNSFVIKY